MSIEQSEKPILIAILAFLKDKKFKKSAKALRKELTKKYGDDCDLASLPRSSLTLQQDTETNCVNSRGNDSNGLLSKGFDGNHVASEKKVAENAREKGKVSASEAAPRGQQKSSNSDKISKADSSKDRKKAKTRPSAQDSTSKQGPIDIGMTAKPRTITSVSSSSSSCHSSRHSPSFEPSRKKSKNIKPNDSEPKASLLSSEEANDFDSNVSDVEVSDVSSVDVSSSDDDSGDESSEEEVEVDLKDLSRRKQEAEKKAKEAARAASTWKPSNGVPTIAQVETRAGTDGAQALVKGKPFQRVDSSYWSSVAAKHGGAIADNSYEGAFGNSGFGAKSSEKLQKVRGKDFRHEKTKRKRSFNGFARTGGQINTDQSFSTKFSYPDDD